MSGNTTATERLLEVSNKLWDAMYESGEVPTYAERAHYYLALKDAMDESAKLRELVSDYSDCLDTALLLASDAGYPVMPARDKFLSLERRKREMGIEVD